MPGCVVTCGQEEVIIAPFLCTTQGYYGRRSWCLGGVQNAELPVSQTADLAVLTCVYSCVCVCVRACTSEMSFLCVSCCAEVTVDVEL